MLKDADYFLEKSKPIKGADEEIKEKMEETIISKDLIVIKEDTAIDQERERAIVLLQRLIKGRNEQNKM